MNVTKDITETTSTYTIKVVAEDGTEKTYTLTVNRLSNNVKLDSLKVIINENNTDTEYEPTLRDDGTYYLKT